ncbi:MAG: hypothetical protein WDO71_19395 [Bacteroidota bacterium]
MCILRLNAVNGSSRAYRDAATEAYYYYVSGGTTGYHYYKTCGHGYHIYRRADSTNRTSRKYADP